MNRDEAEQLTQALFDGSISEADFERLETALTLDPSLHDIYRDQARLDFHLSQEFESRHSMIPVQERAPVDEILRERQKRQLFISLGTAAAIFVLLGAALYMTLVSTEKQPIVVTSTPDSHISIHGADGNRSLDELRPGSTIEVRQGVSELKFPSGVRAVLSGPANLTVRNDGFVELHEGTGFFEVPQAAVGFTVQASSLLVKDLGTEFVVVHVPDVTQQIHVLKGRVEARSLRGMKHEAVLVAGESRSIGIKGDLVEAPPVEGYYSRQLPGRLPYFHFSFDSVENGKLKVDGEHPQLSTLVARAKQSDGRYASTRIVPGRFGKAISFNGKGDMVRTNWPGVFGSQALTFCAWVRMDGKPNYGSLASWGFPQYSVNDSHQWKFLIAPNGKNGTFLRSSWGHRKQSSVDVDFQDGVWHHVAVVFTGEVGDDDAGGLRFYINGVPHEPTQQLGDPSPPRRPADLSYSKPLTFGPPLVYSNEPKKTYFRGTLDEVFIIEGALSDAQVRRIYRENRYEPGP
ncbi:hypothetical protein HAHE_27120 [Haloferula helveola]|uniref:FecR protein n=1 Tax=Haloferula helveola TaxID=490095 RepID=A0ABM7RLZ0_9BACT|nr:hypothetical protein HAHE_27120 [Haloferula helveola]